MTVRSHYEAELKRRGHGSDSAQLAAIERLDELSAALDDFRRKRQSMLRRYVLQPHLPRGVWMWGGVGRGKSFLMDCFFDTVPIRRKTRIHFHEFMRGVHRELRQLRSVENPLDEVALRVAQRYRLICFDEFHLSDVADAMILERLLNALFSKGLVFVMTSNYRPDDLYPDGLHRSQILPAIELLKQRLDVLNVDAGTDYRRMAFGGQPVYLTPLDEHAERALSEHFDRLATGGDESPNLDIEHRQVRARRRSGGVVWFDFAQLCGGPRSQNDYLEIAARFHTVLLSGVPEMGAGMASEARRFLWLVDVMYDQKVKFIVSAAVKPELLYTTGAMAGEFQRTASRLVEMQTSAYLEAPRRQVAQGIT